MTVPAGWRCEVLVVDNRSTDDTQKSVLDRIAGYPLHLRYLYEPTAGKSNAMNTGIAAAEWDGAGVHRRRRPGQPQLAGDTHAARCSAAGRAYAYTGGPVRPIWNGPCPDWFPRTASNLWGTVAILDYGSKPFVFEDEHKVPLGANFAIRRDLIERVGGFVPSLGRSTTRTMLGQELPELFRRARAAGARGLYVPGNGGVSSHSRQAAHTVVLPPVVVRQRRLARARRPHASAHRTRRRPAVDSPCGAGATIHVRRLGSRSPALGARPRAPQFHRACLRSRAASATSSATRGSVSANAGSPVAVDRSASDDSAAGADRPGEVICVRPCAS